MRKIKVRFNLGRGINYLKWKIEYPSGDKLYLDPTNIQLIMSNCVLKNNKKISQEIFDGSHKKVCAWVLCDSVEINQKIKSVNSETQIKYNPKVQPNWTCENKNVDGNNYTELCTINRSIYIKTK